MTVALSTNPPPDLLTGMVAETDDLILLEAGQENYYEDGRETDRVHYLWFHNQEQENGKTYDVYRVVSLLMLRYLPQEARSDPVFLDTMRTVLSGLYMQHRSQFDVVQILAGMWEPRPVGVMQIYGVVGHGSSLEEAKQNARLGTAALVGALANFAQAVLEPLTQDQVNWLMAAYQRMKNVSVVIGHPDERMAAKGLGREGPGEQVPHQPAEPGVTGQQLEMFLRTMTTRQHEFIAPIIASPIPPIALTRMLAGIADEASVVASQQTGADSVSAGIALSVALSANLGRAVGSAFGRQRTTTQGRSLVVTEGRAHTVGRAHTSGHTVTEGEAHTEGFAHSSGSSVSTSRSVTTGMANSQGEAHTEGSSHTEGSAHTTGSAHTRGSFSSSSSSASVSGGTATSHVATSSHNVGAAFSAGQTASHSASATEGTNHSYSTGASQNVGVNAGVHATLSGSTNGTLGGGPIPGSVGATVGGAVGGSVGISGSVGAHQNVSDGQSASQTEGQAFGTSQGVTMSAGHSAGVSSGVTQSSGWSYGHSSTSGSSESHTNSEAHTTSEADTTSVADSTSSSRTQSSAVTVSRSVGSFSSSTRSVADTVSRSESFSTSTTRSEADTTSEGVARGASVSHADGLTLGRTQGVAQGLGMGFGAIPSFSISRSYQWMDDQAIQMTGLLRATEARYEQGTKEGAYLVDFYILTEEDEAAAAAEVGVRQAFQGNGPLVVTPVQTRRLDEAEQEYIRVHAQVFTPSTRPEPKRATYEPYRDSTILLPSQLAAYTAPALFETGAAVTVQERVPSFAFYPHLEGQVLWGYQYSTEHQIAKPTGVPVRLSKDRFFHTAFLGDTGFGKSVAAQRLVYESTKHWKTQSVVLEFGAGWAKLVNAPGLKNRVEVWHLQPGGTVPFRWNPWQVGRRIPPDLQLPATCEIFKNAGRMGERQLGFMIHMAEKMWHEAGVLVYSDEVLRDEKWGYVQSDEWDVLEPLWDLYRIPGRRRNQRLAVADLTPWERQAVAVHRSQRTGMPQWIKLLKDRREAEPKLTQTDITSLEGVLLRLQFFDTSLMRRIYGPGPDTVAVENLGLLGPSNDRWGISILEGGADMAEYPKIALLGLVAWHLYNDAKVRRQERINYGRDARITQIVFEEANKILTGTSSGGERSGRATASHIFQDMWRDGRRYQNFMHVIAQTGSELPPGIISSCANVVVTRQTNAADRDVAQVALGWSEKGFTDEDQKRFISRIPRTQAIMRLGYTDDPTATAAMLARPLYLDVPEPTAQEVWEIHQRVRSQCGS